MPHGDSVDPQLDRYASQPSPIFRLLPATFTVLVLVVALASVVQLRLALFSFVTVAGNSIHEAWLRPILYGTFGLIAFLLLRAVLCLVDAAIHALSIRQRAGQPLPKTIDEFVQDAGRLHIAPRIAQEAFQLFGSIVPERTSIDLHDDLRLQLGLSNPQIASLLAALPELCDRTSTPADIDAVVSVYDLLHHIECAPAYKSGQYAVRSGSQSASLSPLADLKDALPRDSRFRTRAHFSGLKRRASDYPGPYRRVTDRKPDTEYSGPMRRAADNKATEGQPPRADDSRTHESRVLDRRSSTHQVAAPQAPATEARQRKAAQAAPGPLRSVSTDTSLLEGRSDSRPPKDHSKERRFVIPQEATAQPETSLHRS